jgi:hypothetical protein
LLKVALNTIKQTNWPKGSCQLLPSIGIHRLSTLSKIFTFLSSLLCWLEPNICEVLYENSAFRIDPVKGMVRQQTWLSFLKNILWNN